MLNNTIKSNQIKSNQIKSNQIKSNQMQSFKYVECLPHNGEFAKKRK